MVKQRVMRLLGRGGEAGQHGIGGPCLMHCHHCIQDHTRGERCWTSILLRAQPELTRKASTLGEKARASLAGLSALAGKMARSDHVSPKPLGGRDPRLQNP